MHSKKQEPSDLKNIQAATIQSLSISVDFISISQMPTKFKRSCYHFMMLRWKNIYFENLKCLRPVTK